MEEILEQLQEKYAKRNMDTETQLKGLLHAKPINYWDYIQVDTLLSLQKSRTVFEDETIFIVYHQITELVLKLIGHELKQMAGNPDLEEEVIVNKLGRLTRYSDLLISSFSIMNQGMDYEQYNKFRLTLAPASGFQSAQFRFLEIYCTDLENLIPPQNKPMVNEGSDFRDKFKYIYWQSAGVLPNGEKTNTLRDFESQYLPQFIKLAEDMQTQNLCVMSKVWEKKFSDFSKVKTALKEFDLNFNVEWPKVHLQTAHTYLGSGSKTTAATGGSAWEKYLHPKYQRRIFFPHLYTQEELDNWGA